MYFRNPIVKKDKGFTLPIVLGFGTLMFLLGLTMILKSQGDQITSTSATVTNKGYSVAESGISRFQSLINQNRVIAAYSDCASSRSSSGVCSDTGAAAASWSNASVIPGINTTNTTTVQTLASTQWQDIDSSNAALGQYRLVSYRYNGTPGTPAANAEGALTVEGRIQQNGSGATATASSRTATTRLQVTFLLEPASMLPIPFPGLWVKNSLSTGDTEADVLAYTSASPVTVNNPGYANERSDILMPDPPPKPTTNIVAITDPAGLTLPRSTDTGAYNSATGEYQYSVSQITGTFTITPGYKVAIYLDGNLDMTGGKKAILHDCSTAPSGTSCSPTDAKIYGNPTNTNGELHLGGNASICDIFFLAPTYTVNLNGGGQAQGCGGGANNNGIYWVKAWNGGGQGNHVSLSQTTADWIDLPLSMRIDFPPSIRLK
jgi:hypothetical protein